MPTSPKKNEGKTDYLSRCTREMIDGEGKSADQAYAMCNRMWNDDKGQRQAACLSAPVEFAEAPAGAGKDPERTFQITGYTGQPMDMWWGKLAIDVSGIKAKNKMPVLREHARDRIVGHTRKVTKDDGNLLMSGPFSKSTPDARDVLALADEGHPWEASIGVWPLTVQVLDTDKEVAKVNGYEIRGPAEIWRESEVREVSFVSLGQDSDTAAIALSENSEVKVKFIPNDTEARKMTLEELKQKHPELYQEVFALGAASIERPSIETAARAQERERVMGLAAAQFGIEPGAILKAIVESMVTVEQFAAVQAALPKPAAAASEDALKAKMLELLQATGAPNPGAGNQPNAASGKTWDGEVARLVAEEKITKGQAVRKLAHENPALHAAYLAALKPASAVAQ